MNNRVLHALQLVAEQNNITVEEVRNEIRSFIQGTTPEEIVALVAELIKENTPVV